MDVLRKITRVLFASILLSSCLLTAQTGSTSIPQPIYPIPSQAQVDWHRLEMYAFIHFGLNTFNDTEWGYGNSPASSFDPQHVDVVQWVSTLKQAGMKGVILTAKHHDGFCLWPTQTTDYSVRQSPWMNGRGDLVRLLSDECRRQGLHFGLYLSPWDRHQPEYGRPAYRQIFLNQIKELTTNYGPLFEYWFDGANGGTGWYGGADERREIDHATYYPYREGVELLRANNPNVMIFGGTEPTIRWVGNEKGIAPETNFCATMPPYAGAADTLQWLPAECDVSIRPGWFYHERENHQVKSVASLIDLYYKSVGRGANLLLNCPIDKSGRIPTSDSLNLIAFGKAIRERFRHNLLTDTTQCNIALYSSTTPHKMPHIASLTDGNLDTFCALMPDSKHTTLTCTFDRPTWVNNLMIAEYIPLGQRVQAFDVNFVLPNGQMRKKHIQDSLTTIGHKRILRFPRIRVKGIQIVITRCTGPACFAEIGAYDVSEPALSPTIRIDERNRLILSRQGLDSRIYFRTNLGNFAPYHRPPTIGHEVHTVEAFTLSFDGRSSDTIRHACGIPHTQISIAGDPERKAAQLLFDGDFHTTYKMPKKSITFRFAPRKRNGRTTYHLPDH